ncbi:hypothetical protein K3495_g6209 [Podosphaera aphanis]|nr:hypothetical protein K3495_g6209 [Podosphaera aphanis]
MQKSWNGIARLHNNPQYSDVRIKIFDQVLYAHENIIGIQSEYFKKAFQKRSQAFAEADTKTIEFNEGSGAAYWRAFEYLYTGNYSDTLPISSFAEDPPLLKDVRVYALADMFLIEGLKKLSEAKFARRIRGCALNDSYVACVQEVYNSTIGDNNKMRSEVVNWGVDRVNQIKRGMVDDTIAEFLELIDEGGKFAIDFFLVSNGLPKHELKKS